LIGAYYESDFWLIFSEEKPKEPPTFRALVSWRPTYMSGEAWRVSSPVDCIERKGDMVVIHSASGNTYTCIHERYGTTGLSQCVLDELISKGASAGITVKPLPMEEVPEGNLQGLDNGDPGHDVSHEHGCRENTHRDPRP
jgi:hypothetical protein